MTIEDPVEMDLSDVVQTQVDEDVDFNFATGLKSLLRNDPDVVLIGEIRESVCPSLNCDNVRLAIFLIFEFDWLSEISRASTKDIFWSNKDFISDKKSQNVFTS